MTIVASLQSVGVILVIAMLITPAATAYLLTDRLPKMLTLAVIIGVITALAGLLGSYHFNFASGASMVVFATIVFLLTFVFSPSQGILIRYLRKRKVSTRHLEQDVLKMIYKNSFDMNKNKILEGVGINNLISWLGSTEQKILKTIENIKNKGYIEINKTKVALTQKGEAIALRIIRSHRLWESYLINENVLSSRNIHSDAEEFEHILTDEILDEIDEKLGYPEYDPHGSPIPSKEDVAIKK
jgi:Mn-dependent DtxR family transcriptional regulator